MMRKTILALSVIAVSGVLGFSVKQKSFTLATNKNNMSILTNKTNKTQKYHISFVSLGEKHEFTTTQKAGESRVIVGGFNWQHVVVKSGLVRKTTEQVPFNAKVANYYKKLGWKFSPKTVKRIKQFQAEKL